MISITTVEDSFSTVEGFQYSGYFQYSGGLSFSTVKGYHSTVEVNR